MGTSIIIIIAAATAAAASESLQRLLQIGSPARFAVNSDDSSLRRRRSRGSWSSWSSWRCIFLVIRVVGRLRIVLQWRLDAFGVPSAETTTVEGRGGLGVVCPGRVAEFVDVRRVVELEGHFRVEYAVGIE